MALICLQALRLCPSSGIFTFYSLFYHTRLFRRSHPGTDLSSNSAYSKSPYASSPRPLWPTRSSGRMTTHDVNVLSRGFRTLEISLLFGHETFVGANFGDYHKFMKKVLVMNLFGAHPCR
ncbi:unnamed protein product [Brassica napus]|uniref:(rape) hypothetical protein n=1 Tax=Brassica napus TaxID=3708 RepID=A0A816LBS2_BRANA|nr:unnamed protein product [Brassica napus]